MGACFGSFEKPHGKILRNHSISLRDRSDSEIEGGWRNTPKTITIRGICHNAGAHMDEVHTAMVFDRVSLKCSIRPAMRTGSISRNASLACAEPKSKPAARAIATAAAAFA